MLRRADVAKMLPCVPAAITASDATNTMKSVEETEEAVREQKSRGVDGLVLELQQTYDTKGLAGESEASLPSAISAAAASGPDPDEVLHAKHHDHDKLLQSTQKHHT